MLRSILAAWDSGSDRTLATAQETGLLRDPSSPDILWELPMRSTIASISEIISVMVDEPTCWVTLLTRSSCLSGIAPVFPLAGAVPEGAAS